MMSSKQWFILKTDHHIGPLETQQVCELYQQKRLKDTDLLWAEGYADWRVIAEISEFAHLFAPIIEEELPPDLPPLPPLEDLPPPLPPVPEMLEEPPGIEEITLPVFEFDEQVAGEQIGHEESHDENVEEHDDLVKFDLEDEQEEEDQEDQEEDDQEEFWEDHLEEDSTATAPKDKTKWIIAGVVCVLVLLASLYIFRSPSVSPVFHELRVQDAQRLEAFLRENKNNLNEEQMPFAFSLSRDGRGLMVVSPYPQEAQLYLELESIRGRVLSMEDLSMKAQATLNHHQAWFKELQLNAGMSLAPGSYRYKLTAVPVGPIAHLRRFLQQNGLAKGAIKRFTSEGEVLLLREDQEEFEKKLTEFRAKLAEAQIRPLQERVQHYQTLEQMAEQILSIYREILPTVKKPSDMKAFEIQYAQTVGQLLQTLIIEAHQQSQNLMGTNIEEARTFERLRDFGREVGELVSDMVTTTEQTRGLDVTKKNRLVRQFENRVKNLQRESQRRRAAIEKELESYQ